MACVQLIHSDGTLIAGKVSQRGKKESEVGVFFINKDNSLETFYNGIPLFHETLIKLMEKEFGIVKGCL